MDFNIGLLILLASLAGSFLQRVCGFGFGVFIMTVLPYLMPSYPEATALSGFVCLSQSFIVLVSMYRYVNVKHLIGIFLTFCVFSYFAIKFVSISAGGTLNILLGGILILLGLYFLIFARNFHINPSLGWQIGLGSLSGIMGGLFAMHGPAAIVYFLSSEKSKDEYMAITQAYFVITNLYMSVFRAGNGFVTPAVGFGLLFALPGIVLGVVVGRRVFDRIPAQTLKKVIYFYMILAGIASIFR